MVPLVFDGDLKADDFSHRRVERFIDNLRGERLGSAETHIKTPFGLQRPRLQPYARGLIDHIWYGSGSQYSAEWAGRAGLHLLTGNVISGEGTNDFFVAQSRLIESFRRSSDGSRRIALGRVIVPTDSADRLTRQRYGEYSASRYERTLSPQGERRTLFARDLVGTSEEILEQLFDDPILPLVSEFRLELPYEFEQDDYRQILSDFVTLIAPELGWAMTPATPVTSAIQAAP